MHIPSLSSKRTTKKWFYSLDAQSQYLLSNIPPTTQPSLQELRWITGTEPVYYTPPNQQPSRGPSLDIPRPPVQRAATTDGKWARSSRSLSLSRRWSSKGKGRENLAPPSAAVAPSSIPPALSRSSLSFSAPKHNPARVSPPSPSSLSSSGPSDPSQTPPASNASAESTRSAVPVQHPHHSRVFHAKNLRCQIHTGPCPLCAESCCAYRKAVDVLEAMTATPTRPESKSIPGPSSNSAAPHHLLESLIASMRDAVPLKDRDSRTFIRCSECLRWVCPGCIGVCPVELCRDMVCRECKIDPWGRCEWHDMQGEEDSEGVVGDVKTKRGDEGWGTEMGRRRGRVVEDWENRGRGGELRQRKEREMGKERKKRDERGKRLKRVGIEDRFFQRADRITGFAY